MLLCLPACLPVLLCLPRQSDIEQTVWPRQGAIAERLWSARDLNDADAAYPRVQAQVARMVARGVPVGNLTAPQPANRGAPSLWS